MRKPWKKICLLLLLVSVASCGKYHESIQPLYATENLHLQDVNVQYGSDIAPTTIDPSAVKTVTQKVLGWIPVVGQIVELPIDLTTALLPPLSSISYPDLPQNGAWNDPQLMKILKSVELGQSYIRITPRALRGKDWKPEKCWIFFDCPDVELDDFLKEVRVYLLFEDLKTTNVASSASVPAVADDTSDDDSDGTKIANASPTPTPAPTPTPTPNTSPQVLLASADTGIDYDKVNKVLHFNVSQENIRQYFDEYEHFKVKIVASGGYPSRKVYIDGRLQVNLELKLSSDTP